VIWHISGVFARCEVIDLRSDTVTRPSPGMRDAMAKAEVGDDVFGEDPTVNHLQELAAHMLGQDAALFVPSGVMANQVAIASHTSPGDEVILEAFSHIYNFEGGSPGLLSGVQLHPISNEDGIITPNALAEAIRPTDHHFAQTTLVCLENTHNRRGGKVFPLDRMKEVASATRERGLKIHLDGARLWNASAATGIPEKEWGALADSVSACFSKGLGAPVGSVLAGSVELVDRAHRYRKLFGGGMRQVGILAAAALYALEHHRPLLAQDHEKARLLEKTVTGIAGDRCRVIKGETNIVVIEVDPNVISPREVINACQEQGVLLTGFGSRWIRAVCHLDVTVAEVKSAAQVIGGVILHG
jgi:threonine aldolase